MALTPPSAASYSPKTAMLTPVPTSSTAGLGPPAPQQAVEEDVVHVGFDEANKTVFVNGKQFHADDHQSALESVAALDEPPVAMPDNFRTMSPDEYGGYINRIKDPTVGRAMSKVFSSSVDNLQKLGGRALQYLGAEETGQAIVDQQDKEMGYNQPYQRDLESIETVGDAGMWFATALADAGPSLIYSAVTALAGAAVGAVTGGPVGAGLGAIGGIAARWGGKKALEKAAFAAAQKKLKGEALDEAEESLLSNLALGTISARAQRAGGGAVVGRLAGGQAFGTADVYNEQRESGTPNRFSAAGLGSLYAAADAMPEFFAAKFLMKGAKVPWRGNKAQRGMHMLKSVGTGVAGEGITESFQEGLLISQNDDVDILSKQGVSRLLNSFAAGAAVGGSFAGGGSALLRAKGMGVVPEDGDTQQNIDEEHHDMLKRTMRPQGEMFTVQNLGDAPIPTDDFDRPVDHSGDELLEANRVADRADRGPDGTPIQSGIDDDINQISMLGGGDANLAQQAQYGGVIPGGFTTDVGAPTEGYGDEQQAPVPAPAPPREPDLFEDFVPPEPAPPPVIPEQIEAFPDDLGAAPPPTALPEPTYSPLNEGQMDLPFNPVPPEGTQGELFPHTADYGVNPTAQQEMFPELPAVAGEGMIMLPHAVLDAKGNPTGEQVMQPVDIRQALTESKQRVDALQALKTCLRGAA